jgi:DnaJ-class molecular chaperone
MREKPESMVVHQADLYVVVALKKHAIFERDGADFTVNYPSVFQSQLWGER